MITTYNVTSRCTVYFVRGTATCWKSSIKNSYVSYKKKTSEFLTEKLFTIIEKMIVTINSSKKIKIVRKFYHTYIMRSVNF